MAELDHDFIELVTNFLESSRRIRDAASLADGDPIKQKMIEGTADDFNEVCVRSEALRLLVEKGYRENREFILEELRQLTVMNDEIGEKLAPLVWN